jgi:hypothetical protein
MHMVRHQDVCVNHTVVATGGLGEAVTVNEVVLVSHKESTSIMAALNHVERLFRYENPWSSWH